MPRVIDEHVDAEARCRTPTYYVLASLLDGPLHGYAIIQRAAARPRGRRSVPQDPQALRVALSHVAPAVDPAAGGEERFATAEDGTAR